MALLISCLIAGCTPEGGAAAELASDRMTYPGALCGRDAPRQDLPEWMRVPRWCTTEAPRWGKGETAALLDGFTDRHASALRLGMFWGGLSHYPSAFAPHSPNLREGVDPLAEAMATARKRGMHVLAYLNPNAYYTQNPLYETGCLVNEDGKPWDVKAYGREGTRYACVNNPAFADFYTRAITELVGKYATAGLYVDGLSPHVCYCEHCRRKFREDTGRALPAGLTKLGPLAVLWEMTSDWDAVGEVDNPDHQLYSRWLMKCLTDRTRVFSEAAKAARPDAVVVFHSWPKPDNGRFYDGTLNEIYASKPWNFTLWKRAEFSNWGDVFEVPSLVNIYLRQEPWGGERRSVTTEAEARHLYWQALANGAFPNSWAYAGMERPFEVMEQHADCFDFATTFPTKFLALPRPMFADARHRAVAANALISLRPGDNARLRILEREPGGRLDLFCLRADGKEPTDAEYRAAAQGAHPPDVVYVSAAAFDPAASVTAAAGRQWTETDDATALSGAHLTSSGHGNSGEPTLPLTYKLPPLTSTGPWTLWARVIFPDVGSDSFFYQVSNDGGTTWLPDKPRGACAVGWEQPQEYAWVKARAALTSPTGRQVDRFLSPAAGMFAGLLHAGLPVKELHPNHLNRQSLDGFRVLVLANEVCLSDDQCEVIRAFVREGGGLVATHETSLYDLRGKRRRDFGLAEAFGARVRGSIAAQEGQRIEPATGTGLLVALPAAGLSNREEHLSVEARPDTVAAWLAGPGVPGGRAPAMVLSSVGRGRVVYLPGRLDSSYSLWADQAFVALARAAVKWVAQANPPAEASCPGGIVGVTCFDQPARNRRLVHLVAYDADWVESFDELPPLTAVRVRLGLPAEKELASVRAVLASCALEAVKTDEGVEVVLPRLEEYEVLELKWK